MDNQQIDSQPQEIPVQTPPPDNYNWLRTLTIGFGIVSFCIAIGVGGYILGTKNNQTPQKQTQTTTTLPTTPPSLIPDPTANWKTYANSQFEFSLKYPATWIIYEYVPDQYYALDIELTSREKNLKLSNHANPEIGLTLTVNKTAYDKDALQKTGVTNGGLSGNKFEVISFLGFSANKTYTTFTDTIPGTSVTYIIFNQGKYGWSLGYPNINFQGEHDQIYDQILSTFKFTN